MQKIFNLIFLTLLVANIGFLNLYGTQPQESFPLKITFLNIGQGDSMLLEFSNSKFGLIDTGRDDKVTYELASELPPNTTELEFVLLTHPDSDHIGGFKYVAQKYKIKTLFFNKIDKQTKTYLDVLDLASNKQINIVGLNSESDFKIDEILFDVIWPDKTFNILDPDIDSNDTSIGLILKLNNFTMYTAGDLGIEYEEESLKNISSEDLPVDILKVGHHGSKNSSSSDFLHKIMPTYSIISVGINSYGHPNKDVITRLNQIQTNIHRTDLEGNITFDVRIGGEYVLKSI